MGIALQLVRVTDIIQFQIFKSIFVSRGFIVMHNTCVLSSKSRIFWSNSKLFATYFQSRFGFMHYNASNIL